MFDKGPRQICVEAGQRRQGPATECARCAAMQLLHITTAYTPRGVLRFGDQVASDDGLVLDAVFLPEQKNLAVGRVGVLARKGK